MTGDRLRRTDVVARSFADAADTTRSASESSRSNVVYAQYADAAAVASYADSYRGWSTDARYAYSRLYLILECLRRYRGGALIDVGCGPGIFVHQLLDHRPDDFRITAMDRSPAMAQAAAARAASSGEVRVAVGRAEDMPFPDESFDVVVAMGVLEYCDIAEALRELVRVTRPGGAVLVTMLNPLSPFRLVEWYAYWPLLRVLGRLERFLTGPAGRRHGVAAPGIRAYPARKLRRMMTDAGLQPVDLAYYDLTPCVPPLDRIVRRWSRGWRENPERTVSRGFRSWMGTAYLVVAHRAVEPVHRGSR